MSDMLIKLFNLKEIRDDISVSDSVVGWVEEENMMFYRKVADAVEIPGSEPGIYSGMVK